MRSQRDVCLITDSENEDRQKIINVDIGRSDLFRTATIVKRPFYAILSKPARANSTISVCIFFFK